ncbi:DUF4476 domain-containing protein [Pedobacter gandavensis]|uniref:DUF4476 domain-containing protein n=1 Tax=Pedobacter gandavensis TaxID=2679963 RepID=UPI00292FEB6B|nr:DUF4476 domain-containing protein [Pedobacter gandavensis]
MKKLLLLITILVHSMTILAQNGRSSSELFIEIPDRGDYVIHVDGDLVGTSKGRFRFYDIRNTAPTVVVMKDNAEIFRRRINLPYNTRLVASYSQRTGWRNLTTLNLFDRGEYALDNWDRAIFSDRPAPGPDYGPGSKYDDLMTPEEFKQLLATVKKEPFSKQQLKIIKIGLRNSLISTGQLVELMKVQTFDGDRLETAIAAYPSLVDKKNALKIGDAFGFSMSKDKFFEFLDKQR